MKIIFEKLEGNRILDSWTRIFESVEELLEYMAEHKDILIGNGLWLRIRQIKDIRK